MKFRRLKKLVIFCFGLVSCCSLIKASDFKPFTETYDIAVILNVENFQRLSEEDVKNIFLGRLTEYPVLQTKIDKILVKDSTLNTQFNSRVLKMSNVELRKLWAKLLFTGMAPPPVLVDSSNSVINEVSSNINAISYIPLDKVTNDVRIAFVIRQED